MGSHIYWWVVTWWNPRDGSVEIGILQNALFRIRWATFRKSIGQFPFRLTFALATESATLFYQLFWWQQAVPLGLIASQYAFKHEEMRLWRLKGKCRITRHNIFRELFSPQKLANLYESKATNIIYTRILYSSDSLRVAKLNRGNRGEGCVLSNYHYEFFWRVLV